MRIAESNRPARDRGGRLPNAAVLAHRELKDGTAELKGACRGELSKRALRIHAVGHAALGGASRGEGEASADCGRGTCEWYGSAIYCLKVVGTGHVSGRHTVRTGGNYG